MSYIISSPFARTLQQQDMEVEASRN